MQAKEIFYVYSPEIAKIAKLFPTPKGALHNFYQIFYQEKNKTVQLSPSYKLVKDGKNSKWICSYHVSWPEEIKFLAKDVSKKEASYKAALSALYWLKQEGKIAEDGSPNIYDKEEVRRITRNTLPSIVFSPKTIKNIQKLVDLYEHELLPSILADKEDQSKSNDDLKETNLDAEVNEIQSNRRRKFFGELKYMSKEKLELPITKYK